MKLPIFPLNGAVLFPGTNLPLNIFEKKYISVVDYALSNNRLIGMIQKKDDGNFFNIGCVGKITNFTETTDGRYEINLEGLNRFRFNKITKNEFKFIIADVDVLISKDVLETQLNTTNRKLLNSFKKYLHSKKINLNTKEFENLDNLSLAKLICVISPLDYLVKQMLLEFDNADDFFKNLLSVLEIEMQSLENKIKLN
jgi:Lon protease-like protein